MLAILVAERNVREWSAATETREPLEKDPEIHDPTLSKPLKVKALLEARGLEPSTLLRERILGCRDLEQLQHWQDRAIAAWSTEKVDG